MIAYGVIRYFMLSSLAAFVALRDRAYENVSARPKPIDRFLRTGFYMTMV
jgi:hypothetical protein